MPTYTYRREDGSTFEIEQRITEDALATCPTTGQSVKRLITGGAGLVFKGSGFYLTDYARKDGSGESKSQTTKPADQATSSDSSSKSETKTADSSSTNTAD